MRATATISTLGIEPGDYLLVVSARGTDAAPIRHGLALTLRPRADAPVPGRPVNAGGDAPVLRPMAVAHGPSTSHAPVGAMVIRSEGAWKAFWAQLPTRQPPPAIDFTRATLLAFVIEGDADAPVQPMVERIERDGEAIVVRWRAAAAPASQVPGGRPFTVVGVLGHEGPVRFERVD